MTFRIMIISIHIMERSSRTAERRFLKERKIIQALQNIRSEQAISAILKRATSCLQGLWRRCTKEGCVWFSTAYLIIADRLTNGLTGSGSMNSSRNIQKGHMWAGKVRTGSFSVFMMKEKRRGLTIKVMTDGGDMIRCRNFLMRIPRNLSNILWI